MQIDLPADYQPSAGEINNLVYLCCKYTAGWPMRQADLAVVELMRDKELGGKAAIENIVNTACEYVWDHICGEPDDYSPEQFVEYMTPAIEEWYKTSTPEERASID